MEYEDTVGFLKKKLSKLMFVISKRRRRIVNVKFGITEKKKRWVLHSEISYRICYFNVKRRQRVNCITVFYTLEINNRPFEFVLLMKIRITHFIGYIEAIQ